MKRIVSIVLTLTLLLSCVCFLASAESESYSGVYNGYNYYCYGSVSRTEYSLYMRYYDADASIKIRGTYNYNTTNGLPKTSSFTTQGKGSVIRNQLPDDFLSFRSVAPGYYVGSTCILRFTLSA